MGYQIKLVFFRWQSTSMEYVLESKCRTLFPGGYGEQRSQRMSWFRPCYDDDHWMALCHTKRHFGTKSWLHIENNNLSTRRGHMTSWYILKEKMWFSGCIRHAWHRVSYVMYSATSVCKCQCLSFVRELTRVVPGDNPEWMFG